MTEQPSAPDESGTDTSGVLRDDFGSSAFAAPEGAAEDESGDAADGGQLLPLPPDPALEPRPPSGVGLCLSGGGYRAMLFHLGSLLRLNEAGWLPKLTHVASVSGGSITAGVLGQRWNDLDFVGGVATNLRDVVIDPILEFAGRTVDVPAVLLGVWTGNVAGRVAGAYDRHLFGGATLQDLPSDGPRFTILATDLSNGVSTQFSRASISNYKSTDAYKGYTVKNPTTRLADAVAASSAFPPFFTPFKLDLPSGRRVLLTDGGVYDNLGLEPVLKNVGTIFVSDGGGPFEITAKPPTDWLFGTVRVLLTIQSKVGDLRRLQVVKALVKKQRAGSFWAVDTDPAGLTRLASTLPVSRADATALALSPTRLAHFAPELRHRLANWGYAVADACLRAYVDPNLPEPAGFPLPDGVGDVR